ncbi:MAG: hypothetical protein BWX80_01230 [Candidatus Hydrogenedentes bacterium ADurb.Bin101]|nr:MAG: hypothetical protein BWX80_01230 [Candidatus Hydrogenedentes bacterium ADurb.Bin101]
MEADFILPYIPNACKRIFRIISAHQRHATTYCPSRPAEAPITGGKTPQAFLPQKETLIPAGAAGASFRNLHE